MSKERPSLQTVPIFLAFLFLFSLGLIYYLDLADTGQAPTIPHADLMDAKKKKFPFKI